MATFSLSDEQKTRLEHFMKHRRLNDEAVTLLKKAKDTHQLKSTDLRTAKNLTYLNVTENLIKAVNQGWIALADLVKMLDDSEFSGKQHVCLFKLPDAGAKKILDALRTPSGSTGSIPKITDFISLPTGSTVRILRDTKDEVAVKIVTRRSYWVTNLLEQKPDREVLERLRHEERAAVIVKATLNNKMLQCRVPPREKGPQETGKAVYEFLVKALEGHYPVDPQSWFGKVGQFPISDAFPKILKNKTDFELWHDTPEDKTTRTRMSKRGRPKSGTDLRNEKNWQFEKGYSRTNIRGFWKTAVGMELYVHMNADRVRLNQSQTRNFARLVVTQLCTDGDLDHVVDRIRDHL